MASFRPLFPVEQLGDGRMRRVTVQGQNLVIVRQGDEFYALADRCTHENYALSDGFLESGKIGCPMHGATFDLRSGTVLTPPAYEDVAVYPVRVINGMVEVEI